MTRCSRKPLKQKEKETSEVWYRLVRALEDGVEEGRDEVEGCRVAGWTSLGQVGEAARHPAVALDHAERARQHEAVQWSAHSTFLYIQA